jgi:hypothetical protein
MIRTLVSQLRRLEREGRACVDLSASARQGTTVETELAPDVPHESLALVEESPLIR